jgi:large subunit ribosomal protein L18
MSFKASKKRKERTRFKIKQHNRSDRPRVSVNRTNKNIGGQVIDIDGKVLASFSSFVKGFEAKTKGKKGVEIAAMAGEELGKIAVKNGVKEVVFDKGPYIYIGRVKAFADGCRKAGLIF